MRLISKTAEGRLTLAVKQANEACDAAYAQNLESPSYLVLVELLEECANAIYDSLSPRDKVLQATELLDEEVSARVTGTL